VNNNSDIAAAAVPGYRAGTWKADPAHSDIRFAVRQLITKVRGRMTSFDITIVTGDDPLDSSVRATIDLASVETGNSRRDGHVRSSTFLDVADHPRVTYASTGVRRAGAGWVVDGDLTLHGVTRAVPLAVAATGFVADLGGGGHAGFSATALVDRSDFGIDGWSGGGVVGTKVPISLEITAVLVPGAIPA
jgi:polyisoprenoid-binding protein YceI